MIYLLKIHGGMFDEQMMPFVKENMPYLRKPNGSTYSTEPRRVMRGVLNANTKLFQKD